MNTLSSTNIKNSVCPKIYTEYGSSVVNHIGENACEYCSAAVVFYCFLSHSTFRRNRSSQNNYFTRDCHTPNSKY